MAWSFLNVPLSRLRSSFALSASSAVKAFRCCFDKMSATPKTRKKGSPNMSMTPDQAKFVLAMTLPNLKNEHATTKRVIEAIPLDKGDYRPDPVSKSALELAWHIVAAEKRFLAGVCTGTFDFTPINR
jgi:hypothetical protein